MAVDLGTGQHIVRERQRPGDRLLADHQSSPSTSSTSRRYRLVGADAQRIKSARTPRRFSAVRALRHGIDRRLRGNRLMLHHFIAQVSDTTRAAAFIVLHDIKNHRGSSARAINEAAALRPCAPGPSRRGADAARGCGTGLPFAEPMRRIIINISSGRSRSRSGLAARVGRLALRVPQQQLRPRRHDHRLHPQRARDRGYGSAEHRGDQGSRICSAAPLDDELIIDIRGHDLVSGLPRELQLFQRGVPRPRVLGAAQQVLAAVHATLSRPRPELQQATSRRRRRRTHLRRLAAAPPSPSPASARGQRCRPARRVRR